MHAARIEEIVASPSGASTGAFFDLDRTLIAGFSAGDVLLERALDRDLSVTNFARAIGAAVAFGAGSIDFVRFVNGAAADLAGRSDTDNRAFGRRVFEERVAQRIYPEARALIEAHRARGHTLAIVSSATTYQVEPVAQELAIPNVLCTRLEVVDGVCTGRVSSACYGAGKADAASRLAAERSLDLAQSFFYSDGIEDLPLFEAVGHPRPLNPDRRLAQLARARTWPVTHFESRGVPTPAEVARVGVAFGAALPASAAGFLDYAFNRSSQSARNLFYSLWGELASAAIDLDLDVSGEANLWSHRPAVFVFNHQSALDAVVVAKLLRRDFAGVAKQELSRLPLIGQIAALLGTVFIDRGNTQEAITALEPAVAALRRGTSIAIAPEGTRSTTLKLGAFKKGAFHVARQARVPIVPIVIKNTTDRLPKGAFVPHPGAVAVDVLDPIDTSGWSHESVALHAERVRALFLVSLGQGPA